VRNRVTVINRLQSWQRLTPTEGRYRATVLCQTGFLAKHTHGAVGEAEGNAVPATFPGS